MGIDDKFYGPKIVNDYFEKLNRLQAARKTASAPIVVGSALETVGWTDSTGSSAVRKFYATGYTHNSKTSSLESHYAPDWGALVKHEKYTYDDGNTVIVILTFERQRVKYTFPEGREAFVFHSHIPEPVSKLGITWRGE